MLSHGAYSVNAADLDGDGRTDLAVSFCIPRPDVVADSVTVLLNTGGDFTLASYPTADCAMRKVPPGDTLRSRRPPVPSVNADGSAL